MRETPHSTRDAGKTMEPSVEHWDMLWEKTRILAPHDTVLAAIEKLDTSMILEVGAGSGRDLEELRRRGYDVVYADFSPVAVGAFSGRNPGVPAVIADCRCLPFRDESIDLVLSLGLLEHFERETRRTIIQEKLRVARRYTLIDVPQTLSPMMLVKKALMALGRWSYGEETQFTFSQLLRELRSAGDHCEVVGQYGRELVPLPRNVKNVFYSRLPAAFRSIFIMSHSFFARGLAGSFGIIVAKTRDRAPDNSIQEPRE